MRYYACPRLGTGTATDPYRPDVPVGTSWAGNVGASGKYLLATPAPLPAKMGRTEQPDGGDLKAAASTAGFAYDDVKGWRAG